MQEQESVSMAIQHIHTYCAMCVSHCGVVATVEDGIFTKVQADPAHPNGCICVKGTAAPEIVYSPDRLQYPMRRTRPKGERDPGWVRISWDEAMDSGSLTPSGHQGPVRSRGGGLRSCDPVPAAPPPTSGTGCSAWPTPSAAPTSLTTIHICNWNLAPRRAVHLRRDATPSPGLRSCPLHSPLGPQPPGLLAGRRRAHQPGQSAGRQAHRHRPAPAQPGREGGLLAPSPARQRRRPALGMIHVLLEEALYDEPFVREWTNGAFLVREDTQQLLTGAGPRCFRAGPGHLSRLGRRGGGPWAITPTAGTRGTAWRPRFGHLYRHARRWPRRRPVGRPSSG